MRQVKDTFPFAQLLIQAVKKYGLWETVVICYFELIYELKFRSRSYHQIEPNDIDANSGVRAHSSPYLPSAYYSARQAFSQITPHFESSGFVDYGSGFGRALLFASQFPFQKIIGVEISKYMAEQARYTLSRYYRRTHKISPEWEIRIEDAREFEVPDDSTVFYFYDPFDSVIMESVLDRIEESIERTARRVFLIYIAPIQRHLFDERSYHVVGRSDGIGEDCLIYSNERTV